MKRTQYSLAALACAAALLPAASHAGVVVLDFEGLQDAESVDGFYNGGAGSNGSTGTNHGVEFLNTQARIDTDDGGSARIANEPSGQTAVYFASNSQLNVASGFTTGFSFFYSSFISGSVTVYDGLNATGNVLATLNVASQYNGNGCVGDPTGTFCNWTAVGASFTGTAYSVSFSGFSLSPAFDDITLGSATPGAAANASSVPVPGSLALLGLGLAGLGLSRCAARARASGARRA